MRISAGILLLFIVLFPHSSFAGGGGLMGGATEMTQLANNTELANILGQEYEQVANQVKQITNQVRQLEELIRLGMKLNDRITTLTEGQFESLSRAVNAATGLYSDGVKFGRVLSEAFEKSETEGTTAEERRCSSKATALSAANAVSEAAMQQGEDISSLQKMYERNYGAETPMQAHQIQNEIGLMTIEQLIKSRTDVGTISILMLEERRRQMEEIDAAKRFFQNQLTTLGGVELKYKRKGG